MKMKIENISLSEQAWSNIEQVMDNTKGGIPRDLLLGALINTGLGVVAKDMTSISEGEAMEDVLSRVAKERGVSKARAEEFDKAIEEGGMEGCFQRTV